MKALIYDRYGPPEVLCWAEVAKPDPGPGEVRIKICATSLNASDWEILTGRPLYARFYGLFKPGSPILGSDIAGWVDAVGEGVRDFKSGDAVFGDSFGHFGGFAEYVCVSDKVLVPKPEGLSFAEAAALPQAGVLALQGMTQAGALCPGKKVMINGAGGSGGSFAIQMAKQAGAHVTAVDHGGKRQLMQRLGADEVLDYTIDDFASAGPRFDAILDFAAHRAIFAYQRSLHPEGRYFMAGGSMGCLLQTLFLGGLISRMTCKKMRVLAHHQNRKDMAEVAALCVAGDIRPIIDRQYPFHETLDALCRLGAAKALGKLVVVMS